MGNAAARALPPRALLPLLLRDRRARLLLTLAVLALLSRVAGRKRVMARLYAALAASKPRLVYRATPANAQLLAQCPSLTRRKYCPPPLLLSGHIQTLQLSRANDLYAQPAIAYQRELVDLPDGGVVSLDWAPIPHKDAEQQPQIDSTRRTVLILPGLTGGSPEFYIRKAVQRLNARGWQCVVLNARACANTPLRTPQLFSSAYTEDVRFVSRKLKAAHAFDSFIGLGFSMGANVLVKFLGEEGDTAPLSAGISVGNPFDLTICSHNFAATLFNRLTYDKALTGNLKNLFFDRSNAHEVFQGYPGVDIEGVRAARTVHEFDDRLTKTVFHYATVDDYYHDASSRRRLSLVRVPLLCVSAADDPISIERALPTRNEVEENDNVILCVTNGGGHLGFFQTADGEDKEEKDDGTPRMWSVPVIADFADAVWRLQHGEKLGGGASAAPAAASAE